MTLNTTLVRAGEEEGKGVLNGSEKNATGPLITLFVPLFMFATGVLGNLVALALLWRSRRDHSRSVFYRLVGGLALTDLLGTLATSPVTILVYSKDRQWVGGQAVCDYFSFMMVFSGLATVLVVGCLAVERFLAILHPYTYERRVSPERATATIIAVWVVSALFSCLPFVKVGRNVKHWPGTWCFFDFYSERIEDKVFAFVFAIIGLVVIVATAVCNVAVMVILLRMRRISQNLGKSREGRTLNMTSEMQMIFFLAGIILVFAACYSPLTIRIILNVTGSVPKDEEWDLLAIRLASVNQILDPWVYLLFRRRLAALLYSACKSVSPLHTLSSFKAFSRGTPDLARASSMKEVTCLRVSPAPDSPDLVAVRAAASPRPADSSSSFSSSNRREVSFEEECGGKSVDLKKVANGRGSLLKQVFNGRGSVDLKQVASGREPADLKQTVISPESLDLKQVTKGRQSVDLEQVANLCSGEDLHTSKGSKNDHYPRQEEDPQSERKDHDCVVSVAPDGGRSGDVGVMEKIFVGNKDGGDSSGYSLPNENSLGVSSPTDKTSGKRYRKTSWENPALSLEGDNVCVTHDDMGKSSENIGRSFESNGKSSENIGKSSENYDKLPVLTNHHCDYKKDIILPRKTPKESSAFQTLHTFNCRNKLLQLTASGCVMTEHEPACGQTAMLNSVTVSCAKPPSNSDTKTPHPGTQCQSTVAKLTTSASWPVICRHGNQIVTRREKMEEDAEVTDCFPVRKKRHSHMESDCFPLLKSNGHSQVRWPCQQCQCIPDQPITFL